MGGEKLTGTTKVTAANKRILEKLCLTASEIQLILNFKFSRKFLLLNFLIVGLIFTEYYSLPKILT